MNKVEIIAEIGVNHDGCIHKAKELIKAAKDAGADYAKFQLYDAEHLVTLNHKKAKYQFRSNDKSDSHFEMLYKYQLRIEEIKELKKFAELQDIGFMLSAFDLKSVSSALSFKLPYYKIPSGEITNQLSLELIASINQPLIVSTGMSDMLEIAECLKVLGQNGQNLSKVTLLHCSSEYPAKLENLNLNALTLLKESFQTRIGYSDHTQGIKAGILSVALGASVIEKHITLDCNDAGPDHMASLDPDHFKAYVDEIRGSQILLGKKIKQPSKIELDNAKVARQVIVAKTNIKADEEFDLENLTLKRAGQGMSPMLIRRLIGQKSSKAYLIDDLIDESI
jgi:N,N'-diacetyllegionaminate synthase